MVGGGVSGFTVGQETVLVVGMEGVVQSVSEDGVTIGGIRLPTRLDHGRGVRGHGSARTIHYPTPCQECPGYAKKADDE